MGNSRVRGAGRGTSSIGREQVDTVWAGRAGRLLGSSALALTIALAGTGLDNNAIVLRVPPAQVETAKQRVVPIGSFVGTSLDNDYWKTYENLYQGIFQKHPYGTQTVIGTIDHLSSNLADNTELFEMSAADDDEKKGGRRGGRSRPKKAE